MNQQVSFSLFKAGFTGLMLTAAVSVSAAPEDVAANAAASNIAAPLSAAPMPNQTGTGPASTKNSALDISGTLAAQLQPTGAALSAANQELLSRNAQLQRQVNDLQTQVNVLVYESKGQLFLYGAFTVLISLLVGIFVSWLVFVRRERW